MKIKGPFMKVQSFDIAPIQLWRPYTTTKHGFYATLVASCLKLLYSQYLEYTSNLNWLNVFIMTKIKSSNVCYD
jgi:hypothetical protein